MARRNGSDVLHREGILQNSGNAKAENASGSRSNGTGDGAGGAEAKGHSGEHVIQ